MVKESRQSPPPSAREASSPSSLFKYKGVRKRKWGKYVSEIRLPNCRQRIWLGSYDTAEKAARAFDAALYCLRGRAARFNFPDSPPEIANACSLTPAEIQVAAARFAHRYGSGQPESESDSESPCPSRPESDFMNMGAEINTVPDFGIFPGFDDFMLPPLPTADLSWPDNTTEDFSHQESFLWNF